MSIMRERRWARLFSTKTCSVAGCGMLEAIPQKYRHDLPVILCISSAPVFQVVVMCVGVGYNPSHESSQNQHTEREDEILWSGDSSNNEDTNE